MQEVAHFGLQLALKNVLNIDLRNREKIIRQSFLNATLATGSSKFSVGLCSKVPNALSLPAVRYSTAKEKKSVFTLSLQARDQEARPVSWLN